MTPVSTSVTSLSEQNQFNVPGDESDVESVNDWLEPALEEAAPLAAPRRSSRFSESMVIEVCYQCLFGSKLIL